MCSNHLHRTGLILLSGVSWYHLSDLIIAWDVLKTTSASRDLTPLVPLIRQETLAFRYYCIVKSLLSSVVCSHCFLSCLVWYHLSDLVRAWDVLRTTSGSQDRTPSVLLITQETLAYHCHCEKTHFFRFKILLCTLSRDCCMPLSLPKLPFYRVWHPQGSMRRKVGKRMVTFGRDPLFRLREKILWFCWQLNMNVWHVPTASIYIYMVFFVSVVVSCFVIGYQDVLRIPSADSTGA